jgi:signal transduction histidine kinase/predicted CoA-binding protein
MSEAYEFLKKVPLFTSLPDEDLEQLCNLVQEVHLPEGEMLFVEGSMGDTAYVIKEGQLEIFQNVDGRKVQLAIRRAGEVIGEMSILDAAPRSASGKALTDCRLLAISHEQLNELLSSSPSAWRIMMNTITNRLRTSQLTLEQNRKMAQLGVLTAGIAHELNNPAAAARRGARQLSESFARIQNTQLKLNLMGISDQQVDKLLGLDRQIRERAAKPVELDSLTRSDREDGLEELLEDYGIEEPWEAAPALVELDYQRNDLERLSEDFPDPFFLPVIDWIVTNYTIYSLLNEIGQGASRISEIVKALKSYVYLDQGPVQEVNVIEDLENTLVILRHKLKEGVDVKREYSQDLPSIQAYGSELNQVWTNLIDNAVDAMDGNGQLTIRAYYQDPEVVVEIEDNGPGIPDEIQSKLFSPFFTTKPVGKGTGLGLNLSYNTVKKHGGEINLDTQPGRTCFQVRLPLHPDDQKKDSSPSVRNGNPDDSRLVDILEETETIAVVGMSDKQEKPAHTVPAYLMEQGYTVIPVNPVVKEVLGQKSYPDLTAVPENIDIVLIFRRPEFVPEIIDKAIQIGARVVWMQPGARHEEAAQKARQSGLEVVMDTCIRENHKRLFGS